MDLPDVAARTIRSATVQACGAPCVSRRSEISGHALLDGGGLWPAVALFPASLWPFVDSDQAGAQALASQLGEAPRVRLVVTRAGVSGVRTATISLIAWP